MFEHFPKRWFVDLEGEHLLMTNICRKFRIPKNLVDAQQIYLKYYIRDGDTARSLATRLYGDSELFWLVYLANNIKDPANEWPKSEEQLTDWLVREYGLEKMYQTKHYINPYGDVIDIHAIKAQKGLLSMSDSDAISRFTLEPVTYDKYHRDINDKRRNMRLIDPDYADEFQKALETVFDEDQ
ncbi:hypothetical protein [Vibrio phage BX-1]|nr:hypothetical protein [Vibrio phage BX-1]